MNPQTKSASPTPRFDQFFTAAGSRRDEWQRLQGLGQAWTAAAAAQRDPAKLVAQAKQLLNELEPLETYFAYPGPSLMQRLHEKIDAGDHAGFAELSRRTARSLLGGGYRRDEKAWEAAEDENGENRSRAPSDAGNGQKERLYFEVLVVGSGAPADAERVRREMRQLRRPEDPFVYELAFAASFEDAALATICNGDIQAVVIYEGFPWKSK